MIRTHLREETLTLATGHLVSDEVPPAHRQAHRVRGVGEGTGPLVTGPISEQSRCNLGHGSNGNGSDGQKNRGGHCVAREARNLGTISCNLAHSPKGNLGGILDGNLGGNLGAISRTAREELRRHSQG